MVIREGDIGDRFYVIAEGEFEVRCEAGMFPPMADGDFFGEIALLRECPRTATVTARSDAVLYALERDSFLCAVGGHRCAGRLAREEADVRLERTPVA